ncbi:TadE/TadG family type IV pilus assembly protein [Teichococcus oryzae]|uniref:TadE/TadG family type IV pilus assembly protein n=1 Tax=Teichococcus oryzae TaxID=1608942 RepID=UPI00137543E0|nr:TadE/TadG family type IV pilus assembly protein [Pseudoroseomonas oryzae]
MSLEFGLVILPFLLLLLGGIDLARYAYTAQAVDSHTEATLRAALIFVAGDTSARCLTDLNSTIAPLDPPAGVEVGRIAQRHAGCVRNSSSTLVITVTVAYRFTFLTTLFGSPEQQISRTVQRSL